MVRKVLPGTIVLFVGTFVFLGCAAQIQHSMRHCPGKKTPAEAIETLNQRCKQAKPIRATGQCLLQYRLDGKGHKENFPIKIWTNPTQEIYLQGDVAFDATGLVFGSNADEFWFWLKPKEISSYWWGKWSQGEQWQGLAISPAVLLEVFGAVEVPGGDWSLTYGRFDILWLHNDEGDLLKRIFIEQCDYTIAKIEYFDSAGRIVARAEFAGYEQVGEGFFVPKLIKITTVAKSGGEDSAEISLTSVKPAQLSDRQRQRLFVRPKPLGFDRVYEIIDGSPVEQTPE